ncbi:MAG: hypothetical protein DMD55_13495 [Gemmatimonadetes bacterium]|nr:MAG: hypothetical protein DMD55_13495 [Gemmatimonadota bacterium]
MKRTLQFGLSVLLGWAPLPGQQPPEATTRHHDARVGFRVGTTGFGVEVAKWLTGHVGARTGGSVFSLSTTKSQSSISYDASLKLHSFAALLDLSPGRRGSFHFTGGLATNPMTITATGQPSSSGTFKITATRTRAVRSAR